MVRNMERSIGRYGNLFDTFDNSYIFPAETRMQRAYELAYYYKGIISQLEK